MNLIEHQFLNPGDTAFPEPHGSMFTYVVGQNGIFARAVRPGIEVMMPVAPSNQPIKGLQQIEPYLRVTPKVPEALLMEMWRQSCNACQDASNEILFHLVLDGQQWQLVVPDQEQASSTCKPLQQTGSTQHAAIEIHSHGMGGAHFSSLDDRDECFGFRIYGVLGKVRSLTPEMILRVGLYGHGWMVPLDRVFEFAGHQFINDLNLPYAPMNCHSIEPIQQSDKIPEGEIGVEESSFKSSVAIEVVDPKTIAVICEYQRWFNEQLPRFNIGDVVMIHDQEISITDTVGVVTGVATYENRETWHYAVMPIVDGQECEASWFTSESLYPAQIEQAAVAIGALPTDGLQPGEAQSSDA